MDFIKLYEDRLIGRPFTKDIPELQRDQAVAVINQHLSQLEKDMLRDMILRCANRYWFAGIQDDDELGGRIRKILRDNDRGESFFKIKSLDWLWKELVERTVFGEEIDWDTYSGLPYQTYDPFWEEAEEGDWPWS